MKYLSAGSNRGDATHAIEPGKRVAVCGSASVRPTKDDFDPNSTYACKKCLSKIPNTKGSPCPECNGTGELNDGDDINDCDLCDGTGIAP